MNKEYIQAWINIAIEDLEISKILFDIGKYSNSFYHFQQASEKGMKAFCFMSKIFTSINDATKTGHQTLKIFKNFINEDLDKIKAFEKSGLTNKIDFEKLTGVVNLEEFSNSLEIASKLIPDIKDCFEYDTDSLDLMLKNMNELTNYHFVIPPNLKELLSENLDVQESIIPQKPNEFTNMKDELNDENFLTWCTDVINLIIKTNSVSSIIYFTNLITHNHNNITRYPNIEFNPLQHFSPLEYYCIENPLIKKLPEFTEHLKTALFELDNLNKPVQVN